MLVTWIVTIGIIAFAQYATRSIQQIPDGVQNFWEFLVEGLRDFLEGILGRDLTKKTFWYFATVFIFILAMNWFGLIPGIGTIGWGHIGDGRLVPGRSFPSSAARTRIDQFDALRCRSSSLPSVDRLGDPGPMV